MDLKAITDQQGEVSLSFGTGVRLVSGIQTLVQRVIVELVSDYNPLLGRGVGLGTIIQRASPADSSQTRADILTAISSAKAHILASQSGSSSELPSERLQNLKPLRVERTPSSEWLVDIEVISFSGETATSNLVL